MGALKARGSKALGASPGNKEKVGKIVGHIRSGNGHSRSKKPIQALGEALFRTLF